MNTVFTLPAYVGIILFFNFYSSLWSMDTPPISFESLPPEAQEIVFKDAMIADPYNAWQLACVCKNWHDHINDLQVTTHVVSINPDVYVYSYVMKPNPRSCLQTAGLAQYTNVTALFFKVMMEFPDITEKNLNDLFCSEEKPHRSIICNKADDATLSCACRHGNLVGVNFLLNQGVMPSRRSFDHALVMIKKKSNHKSAEPYIQCFKLLCDKNLVIARSRDLLFDVHCNLDKKTERFYRLLQVLINAGTDLNQHDEDNDTILNHICNSYIEADDQESYKKIPILCLQHGADPHIKPKYDESVYEFASQEDQSFFELIKAHYKPIEKKD